MSAPSNQTVKRPIRTAFLLAGGDGWMGGVIYYKNLLQALAAAGTATVRPVVFSGRQPLPDSLAAVVQGNPQIEWHRSALFDRKSLPWLVREILQKFFRRDVLAINFFQARRIQVLSHFGLAGKILPFMQVHWIPDFQHVHLSEMFPTQEIQSRNRAFTAAIAQGDLILLSSNDALHDLHRFAPAYAHKARVLHFVSNVDPGVYSIDSDAGLKQEFNILGKYFYLPNQFWKHKNHLVVFRAVRLLKDRGVEVTVVCSGNTQDYRNAGHFAMLQKFIADNSLEKNIIVVGLIPYNKVLTFMRHAVSIINPSFFEGWSTTVEEAKSLGKNLILSNIGVHKEQAAPGARYFNKDSPEELAVMMEENWSNSSGGPDWELERTAKALLPERVRQFGNDYGFIIEKGYSGWLAGRK